MPHWLRLVLLVAGLLILLGFLTEPVLRRRRKHRRTVSAQPATPPPAPVPPRPDLAAAAANNPPPATAAASEVVGLAPAGATSESASDGALAVRQAVQAARWAAETRARAAEARARAAERERDVLLARLERPAERDIDTDSIERFAAAAGPPLRHLDAVGRLLERQVRPAQNAVHGNGTDPDVTVVESLQRMQTSAAQMRRLINGLVTYSRLRHRPVIPRPVDASAALFTAFELLFVRHTQQEAVISHAEPLPTVVADPDQLAELFFHLIHNALVHVGPGHVPHLRISAHRTKRWWLFEIADNGPGIPAEDREQIFALFGAGNPTTARGGVGLALCRYIVAAHHGQIWVEDNPAGGSRFLFTLPADHPDAPNQVSADQQPDVNAEPAARPGTPAAPASRTGVPMPTRNPHQVLRVRPLGPADRGRPDTPAAS